MSPSRSRRVFCRWGTTALLFEAAQWVYGAPQHQLLIGLQSTGHNEEVVYAALERQLRKIAPGVTHLSLVRREAGFSRETLIQQVDELLALRPDILICLDLAAAAAAAKRRRQQGPPIVFLAHSDPVQSGLVQSYARPGNNITGVTTYRCVDGKMVEILAEAFPARRRFGHLLDATVDNRRSIQLAAQAARDNSVEMTTIDVSSPSFIAEITQRLAPLRLDAVVAPASAPVWQNRKSVVSALNTLRLPAIYESELFLDEGGLMYYGPVRTDAIPQVANDVEKILRGEPAGNLPIEQPTLFELVVNLRAAYAADYGIHASTLRRADRILQ
jgi:putative tryptophan/tyrosine transport system substrate-binding protein